MTILDKFKPLKKEKVIISVRITTDMLKRLDDISAKSEMSRNEFINQCIDFALKNYDKD